MERVVVLADEQIPYHDARALDLVYRYISDTKPDMVVELGDVLDLPQLTTKYLRRSAPPEQLMRDIAVAREHMVEIGRWTNRVVWTVGNHEQRLENYILECAPELQGLVAEGQPLSLASLFEVPGLEVVGPYGEAFIHHSFVFTHGSATGPRAAEKELAREGSSGMSGHVHRFSNACRTDRGGEHGWWTIGCLCHTRGARMPPGNINGANRVRDWQQGFATIYFTEDGQFNAYPTVIVEGKFISPNGEEYR